MKQFGIGQPVRRVEDRRFITGHGNYLDDISRPRQTHAYMLRSPHAHARITAIDTTATRSAPGVLTVLTGEDLALDGIGTIPCLSAVTNRDGSASALPPHPAIARERVRHVGDTVAMVVAESAAAARDAAELITVSYDPLPAVVETADALDAGQPRVWDEAPGNLCFDWEVGDRPAVVQAMADARHRIALELVNNRIVVNSMEPRGALGDYDPGEASYSLWSSTQGSHFVRSLLAANVFKVPENRIRVITRDVGGGFGMKLFLYPEHVLVLWAAKKLGRPVKWVPDRADAFMTDTQGRDNIARLELALDEQLRFLGLEVELIANMGAYLSNFAPEIPTISGAVMYGGVYALPAIHVGVKGVFTNTVPVDAYRGAGRPEAAYAIERLVDYAARRLGVPPQELRRRNFVRPEVMPYKTVLGLNYDSGEFARNMDQGSRRPTLRAFRRGAPRHGRAAAIAGSGRLSISSSRVFRPTNSRNCASIRAASDDPDGHTVVGPGASDRLRPARRRAARHGSQKDPGAAGRHCGDLVRPRPRRFALTARRRRRTRARRRQTDRQRPAHRRASVRGRRGRCRICRWRIQHRRH
jgi:carbon-monoxide dehydrogenase large subunit